MARGRSMRVAVADGDAGTPDTDWFVGREEALERIARCVAEVRRGQPRLVLVEGHAGIGKTALVNRLLQDIPEFAVLRASGHPSETEFAFGVVSQLVARVDPAVRRRFPLLGPPVEAAPRSFEVGLDLLGLLGELQGRSPVAVVVDDVPWCDQESLQVLGSVLRRLYSDRVLVLLTARSAGSDGKDTGEAEWRALAGQLERPCGIRLDGLTLPETSLLARRVRGGLTTAAAARLHERTEGHPLYLHRLLNDLTTGQLNAPDLVQVPDSLLGLVRAQTRALPDHARVLAEALAVLDVRCPLATVSQVAGVVNGAEALEPLLAAGLVTWHPQEPSTPVEMRHALIRDAIYHAISPDRRRQLHIACVPVVDSFAAWRHRVAATTRSDGDLGAELEAAAVTFDPSQQATLLLWAADVAESREAHERRLLRAATLLQTTAQFERARQLHAAVLACAPSPLRTCYLGLYATHDGRPGEGERLLTEVVRDAEHDDRLAWLVPVATGNLAGTYLQQGRGADAIAVVERALDRNLWPPDRRNIAWSLLTLGRLYEEGPRPALEVLSTRAGLPPSADDAAPADSLLLTWRSVCHVYLGRHTSAVEDARAALRLATRSNDQETHPQAHFWLAAALYFLGRWDEALTHAERSLSVAVAQQRVWQLPHCHGLLGAVHAGQGAWEAAAEHVNASSRLVRRNGRNTDRVFPAFARALLARAEDDPARMLAALRPLTGAAAGGTRGERVKDLDHWWLPMLAEGLIAAGDLPAAEPVLARLRGIAEQVPWLDVEVGRLRGLLAEASGDPAAAAAVYREALARAPAEDDSPWSRAMLEQAYGRLLHAEHDRRGAIGWLRRAHDRYVAMNAKPHAERTRRELAACGLHSPRTGRNDLPALTSRERAVGQLAAQGQTNEEIARELYVSVKTVEYHLSNVYAKLGVTSRRDLPRVL